MWYTSFIRALGTFFSFFDLNLSTQSCLVVPYYLYGEYDNGNNGSIIVMSLRFSNFFISRTVFH